jgi:diacylglycerol O-acyltransferase-1
MSERLLKLSVSSLYIWLVAFYALFHSFLNAFAEVIRFADRSFYKDWWNATSLEDYWRLWNAPVHQWLKRHIYGPLVVRRGWSSGSAQLAIFTLSAVAHEFLVAVPTNVVQGWAFLGMLLQVPLIHATTWYMRRSPGSSFGNYFFWISFCILGQPMCVLLYYRAWISKKSASDGIFFFF